MKPVEKNRELRCPDCDRCFAEVQPDGVVIVKTRESTRLIKGARSFEAWCSRCNKLRPFSLDN